MSTFDQTTRKVPHELMAAHNTKKVDSELYHNLDPQQCQDFDFLAGHTAGREEIKPSLKALAEVVQNFPGINCDTDDVLRWTRQAYMAMEDAYKAGNWPLPWPPKQGNT